MHWQANVVLAWDTTKQFRGIYQTCYAQFTIEQAGVQLDYDSHGAIYLISNQLYRTKTKHNDMSFHKIENLLVYGKILLENVHNSDNATC